MERIELTAVMKSDVGAVWPDPDSRVSLSGVAGGSDPEKVPERMPSGERRSLGVFEFGKFWTR